MFANFINNKGFSDFFIIILQFTKPLSDFWPIRTLRGADVIILSTDSKAKIFLCPNCTLWKHKDRLDF
jgi:hypothetical protein